MTPRKTLGLLFLHALPLDGTMWAGQGDLLPGATYAPTLYPFGDSVKAWADAALGQVREQRLVVVGCSVGGSCALEVAAAAPARVAALVLIGTKADCRPDPAQHGTALDILQRLGPQAAWNAFWRPLFSLSADAAVVAAAERIYRRQPVDAIARGVTAFHTRQSRGDTLADFAGPVVLVTGAEDIAPGLATSRAQAASARRGRLQVIADCGHYVPMEKPEHLNAILREVIACARKGDPGSGACGSGTDSVHLGRPQ